MRKTIKIQVFLLSAVLAALFAVLLCISAGAEVYGGNCGADGNAVTWSLNTDTGLLTISGVGRMEDYHAAGVDSFSSAPWYPYRAAVKHISVGRGVTSVGNEAFGGCKNLEAVWLPEGLTRIGEDAFFDCESLGSIAIPESVRAIGSDAFYGCTALGEITIPESVTVLDDYVFFGCTKLHTVKLPSGLTEIGSYAFGGCRSLTSVELPDGLKRIGTGAFSRCTDLSDIRIPEGVTDIPSYTFYHCKNLTDAVLPKGVKGIGDYAFYYCMRLKGMALPSGLERIGDYAFGYCSRLVTELPPMLKSIGDYAFFYCLDLKEICVPLSVQSIGEKAFNGCLRMTKIRVLSKDTAIFDSKYTLPEGVAVYGYRNSNAEKYALKHGRRFTILSALDCSKGHKYDDACDPYCDCGYERTAPHSPSAAWQANGSSHWNGCTLCGFGVNKAPHIYTNVCDTTCDTCGYTRVAPHEYSAAWAKDEVGHWHACTLCGHKTQKLDHVWDGGTLGKVDTAAGTYETVYTCGTCLGTRIETAEAYCVLIESKTLFLNKDSSVGQTVTVEISFNKSTAIKSAAVYGISYDKSVLELVGAVWSGAEGAVIADFDKARNTATLTFHENTVPEHLSLTLTFNLLAGAPEGEYEIGCDAIATYMDGLKENNHDVFVAKGTLEVRKFARGDVNGDTQVNSNDAIYLLRYTLMPSTYPINQSGDMNGDGQVNSNDAIHLLRYTLMPSQYPLK
ncbi:MAG: leucine-rich repeat protein [Clostridia bacterium]|nr:leucine-rich repeat protein [Clostridia bacterium]